MIPIKYKKRQFENHRELWHQILDEAVPPTDLGRGKSLSSLIPNLGHSLIHSYLLKKYDRQFCVFTNCASDALDFVVQARPFPVWYVPSYTWLSPVNAVAKSGAEIRFLDVDPETRMVDFDRYDPRCPIVVPHADGRVSKRPPKESVFVLEDAAQSALSPGICFGDAVVLSFGSSKRLGLLGQGGCILTDDAELAEKLQRMSVFGLDPGMKLYEPGFKSFLDPFNAHCTYNIMKMYEDGRAFKRINAVIDIYNEASGLKMPYGLERFTLQLTDRDRFREAFASRDIETRVWFERHALQWPWYSSRFKAENLPNSDRLTKECADIPLNEFLSDAEVEFVADTLRQNRDLIRTDLG